MGETLPAKYRPLASLGKLPSQRKFVEAFCGDVEKTAERIGIDKKDARQWALCEWFSDALEKRDQRELTEIRRQNIYQRGEAIAQRQDIQAMWSDIATNTKEATTNRLKASELLAKSHGMLVEKMVHEGNKDKPIMVAKLDIESRLSMLLSAPVDAHCTPSQPLETQDDEPRTGKETAESSVPEGVPAAEPREAAGQDSWLQ